MIQTEPCPAKSDGSAHHCFGCREPIAVGAPVIDYGARHGYRHHPSCDGASAALAAAPDAGDLVAMALGLLPYPEPKQATPTATNKTNLQLVAEAMGLVSTSPSKDQE